MAGVRIPRRFGLDPVRDIQVLCPTNEGGLGTRALNAELQRVLNPQAGPRIERGGWSYHLGDKVMQLENDYEREVYNGDLGTVAHVDPLEGTLLVAFGTRLVPYRTAELDRLTLAYATTVHKAQGSEYPAVIVPVMAQHGRALSRNLIYTAITRGRRLVVLVGDRAALARGLKVEAERRVSKLRERLESPLAPPAEAAA
jgi:exodeoxyribonuclease V alpha subunit